MKTKRISNLISEKVFTKDTIKEMLEPGWIWIGFIISKMYAYPTAFTLNSATSVCDNVSIDLDKLIDKEDPIMTQNTLLEFWDKYENKHFNNDKPRKNSRIIFTFDYNNKIMISTGYHENENIVCNEKEFNTNIGITRSDIKEWSYYSCFRRFLKENI